MSKDSGLSLAQPDKAKRPVKILMQKITTIIVLSITQSPVPCFESGMFKQNCLLVFM